ncbi:MULTISPECIES: NADAR family protein [Okeania]|uniref:NADAR family protein n=1 Tax=Okeania hirsuta TaxID=1458930 RepID=A0A3N6PJ43_9CYAN|nr:MULTISPECIES: NADAR family protein [Okeania]NET12098.1 NADAR family protein [Okeania sp. SIO1H6]NES75246.1 NADAR family protein [Okeania sp. SIO1H4]NES93085.1 NADAR family protein [Okeania sp. SIO2B9]NET19294.1 NADAR family protein [Okeania sp. SIO1H5]NET75906.1 NADAR family protein [Okeania sp. SIO1F9]
MAISFYSTLSRYGCFSNCSAHGFELDGYWWPTSEHYFQAQKFPGMPDADEIRLAATPGEAANLGGDRKRPLRSDWEQVKYDIMQKAVFNKFATNSEIREILLSTGNEEIVYKSPVDLYWGQRKDGSGKNKLGKILMAVRDMLSSTINN